MPRIRLAYWLGELAPGDEIDVTDEELKPLQRDGRVAEVLDEPTAPTQPAPVQPAAEAEPEAPAAEGRTRKGR